MYLGFQGLRVLAQALPLGLARAVGRTVGRLAYSCLGAVRRPTLDHLAYAFGGSLSEADRRRIARGVFDNLGQSVVEWLKLPQWSAKDLQALVVSDGVEHLRQALAKGRGAIMLTAHFGNWEMISPYLRSLGFEGGVLARRLRYAEYESFLISMRGAKGVPTFARGSLKEVAKVLRANQIIGVLPDQDMDSLDGVFVNFFGRPAYTPVGPAALSVMTGAPILPCFLIREGAKFQLVIEPPVAISQTTDRARTLQELTQAWSAIVESYIRRYPDQWVWMHRRWKTQSTTETAQGSPARLSDRGPGRAGLRVEGLPRPQSPEPRAQSLQPRAQQLQPVVALIVTLGLSWLGAMQVGCAKAPNHAAQPHAVVEDAEAAPPPAPSSESATDSDQQMSEFTLHGYQVDGTKRWELKGVGANIDGDIVTIHHPDAIGYDPVRTAYLTASAAAIQQKTHHVRMEHNVTIHTSDGLWFATPILYWIPDENHVATDTPVRMETDHMLLLGRGMDGLTQLKHLTIQQDVELILNPSDHEVMGAPINHVKITCDGPLTFDYDKNIATFEHNVHVVDQNGELFSDTLVAYLDPASHTIRYAEATGHVRIVQHQNTAYSERAVYEPGIGKITLVGQPSLMVYPSEDGGNATFAFGGLTPAKDAKRAPQTPIAVGQASGTPSGR